MGNLGVDKEFKSKRSQLAKVITEQESVIGRKPELVHVNRMTYERTKFGKGNPTLASMVDICRGLGIDIRFINLR